MTSCDKENEGAIFGSGANNVSWETNKVDIVTDDSEVEVPVKISRTNKSGNLTVNYTVKASTDGIFSDDCKGTVTFADGEIMKLVNVKANIKEKGQKYTYTMTFDDATKGDIDQAYSRNLAQEIKISVLQYSWVDAGTCTFIDAVFYDNAVTVPDVQIIRAKESKNPYIFRIVKPYQKLAEYNNFEEDIEFFADAEDIEFYLNEDGSPNSIKETITIVPGDVNFYFYTTGGYAGYCKFNYKNGMFIVNHLLDWFGDGPYLGQYAFIWDVPSLQ